jgi:hypothetical protein
VVKEENLQNSEVSSVLADCTGLNSVMLKIYLNWKHMDVILFGSKIFADNQVKMRLCRIGVIPTSNIVN